MKSYNFFSLMFIAILLFACSQDSINDQVNSQDQTIKIEAGETHNQILENFFENYEQNQILSKTQNEIDIVISAIDQYLVNEGSDVTFSDIYYNNSDYKEFMNKIIDAGKNISQIKNVFREAHERMDSKQAILDNSLALMDIMLNYEGTKEFKVVLSQFESEISTSKELNSEEKNYMLMAIDVARESNIYWHDGNNNYVPNGFGDIAGADGAGAVMAVQTGAVFYASVSLGPWGGFAALVGDAALTSILAA